MENLLYIGLIMLGVFIGILIGGLLGNRVYQGIHAAQEIIIQYSYVVFPVAMLVVIYILETRFTIQLKITGSVLSAATLSIIKYQIPKLPKTNFTKMLFSRLWGQVIDRTIVVGIITAILTIVFLIIGATWELPRITFAITISETIVIVVYWRKIKYLNSKSQDI